MATSYASNYVSEGDNIKLPVTSGKTPGQPEMVGDIACVLKTLRDSTTGFATCGVEGCYDLNITAKDGSGDSAVAPGENLYYDASPGGTDKNLSKNDSGQYFDKYAGTTTIPAGANGRGAVKLKGGAL
jgi:hypothetical protein